MAAMKPSRHQSSLRRYEQGRMVRGAVSPIAPEVGNKPGRTEGVRKIAARVGVYFWPPTAFASRLNAIS
jgi:hypothetical protein